MFKTIALWAVFFVIIVYFFNELAFFVYSFGICDLCSSIFSTLYAILAKGVHIFMVVLERKTRVEEAWKKMNSGLPVKVPKSLMNKPNSTGTTRTSKTIPVRMLFLLD